MELAEALAALKKAGTAQNRKVYGRHGVKDEMFGVSFAVLKTLKKKIRQDHLLAEGLWNNGNHDARMLACMVADPKQADRDVLDNWVNDIRNYILGDQFSSLAAASGFGHSLIEEWTMDEREFAAQVGWNMIALFAVHRADLDDLFFIPWISIAVRDIHDRANRVRHAMNQAVIAIGCRSENLRAHALAAAAKIGPVLVDHGRTGCKTPDATGYIEKTWKRKKAKKK